MKEENTLSKVCYYYEMFMKRTHGRYELPNPALQAFKFYKAYNNLIT